MTPEGQASRPNLQVETLSYGSKKGVRIVAWNVRTVFQAVKLSRLSYNEMRIEHSIGHKFVQVAIP
jgi:hypothetical protein